MGNLIIFYTNDEHRATPTSPFRGHTSDLSTAHRVQKERQSPDPVPRQREHLTLPPRRSPVPSKSPGAAHSRLTRRSSSLVRRLA